MNNNNHSSNIISLGNSSYNIINNLTKGINSHSDNTLSNWQEVYISFLVEKKFNNIGNKDWNEFVNAS